MLIDTDKTSLDVNSILFQAMLDEIDAYVYIKDSHAKYLYVNEGTRWLFQQQLEAILGHADSDFFTGQQLSDLSKNDQRVLLYGETVRHEELNIPKATGEARIFRTVKKPLFNKQGMILGLIGILTDITDTPQLETTNSLFENALDSEKIKVENQDKRHAQDLAQKNRELDIANQIKSKFLVMMNHELKTPLNAMLGMNDLLQTTELTPEQKVITQITQQSGAVLTELTDHILRFSHSEAGQMVLSVKATRLVDLMDSVIAIMSLKAMEKKLTLVLTIDYPLPETVFIDPLKIKQVLLNLVCNAIEFTPSGSVELNLQMQKEQGLLFSVTDTGIGMDKETQQILFEECTAATVMSTCPDAEIYSALGLAISRQLVEMHDGVIGVGSIEGQGSRFWFSLNAASQKLYTPQPYDMNCWIFGNVNNQKQALLYKQLKVYFKDIHIIQSWQDISFTLRPSLIFVDEELLNSLSQPEIELFMTEKSLSCSATAMGNCAAVLITNHLTTRVDNKWQQLFQHKLLQPVLVNTLESFLKARMGCFNFNNLQVEYPSRQQRGYPVNNFSAPLHILLVEDSIVHQMCMKAMLEELGFVVDVAENGQVATQKVPLIRYALILMDLSMPVMGGIEATKIIRCQAGCNQNTPIIAWTSDMAKKNRCFQAGMTGFLEKPATKTRLYQEIKRAVDLQPVAAMSTISAPATVSFWAKIRTGIQQLRK